MNFFNLKKNLIFNTKNALKTTSFAFLVPCPMSSLQSSPEFKIPFESSQSKTSLPSSSPSALPWPWPPCWPPCWPRWFWGRPGPGPGPHIYFIVWTFQIGRAAAGTEKDKFVLSFCCLLSWSWRLDVKALLRECSPPTCHMSHVTCNMSCVAYYMSHVPGFLDKVMKRIDGGSFINGAYPV